MGIAFIEYLKKNIAGHNILNGQENRDKGYKEKH